MGRSFSSERSALLKANTKDGKQLPPHMKFSRTGRNDLAVIQRIFHMRMLGSEVNLDTWEPFISSRVRRSSGGGGGVGGKGGGRWSTTIKQLSNTTSSPSQPYSLLVSGLGEGGGGWEGVCTCAHLAAFGESADFLTRRQSSCYKYVAAAFSAE